MPKSHKAVTGGNAERYLSWAEKIGPQTRNLIAAILDSREYPVQTYRAYMGIMRLASSFPAETICNSYVRNFYFHPFLWVHV